MFFLKLFFDIRGSTNIINLFYKNLICNHEINHGNSSIDSHCKISMVILKKKKNRTTHFFTMVSQRHTKT